LEAPVWFQLYAAVQAEQAASQAARHLEIMNALFNCNVVSYNRTSFRENADIQPLRGVNGEIPNLFPVTRGDLLELPANTCNALLTAYGLPIGGTLHDRRRRLASHCGIGQMPHTL